jgi:hypothetical protein
MENLAEWEKTKSKYVKRKISTKRWLIALLLTPFALLGLSIGAGLERVVSFLTLLEPSQLYSQ